MKVQFDEVKIGEAFWCEGRRYVKLGLSMTEDQDHVGTIFLAETEVEVEVEGRDSPHGGE